MSEERRLLSVLFADLVGSTELASRTDPEVLRQKMTRYFERMKEIAETHGGTVEKFIGDAVMVVFGAPHIHDDDAERAVRCGLAMQASMADLNRQVDSELALCVGINTGEAVVRSGDDGQFIVGDPINVAARLQQGAAPGEVVVGRLTAHLTSAAIEYADRAPAMAKGKSEPIQSFQAIRPRIQVPRRLQRLAGMGASLVGREREVRQVLESFNRVVQEQQAQLVTVVGAAGVGKSRLIEEALQQIASHSTPTILHGRCLPYGRGITYWPLVEILQSDSRISHEDDSNAAIRKLDERLAALGLRAEQAAAVRRRLAVVLGLTTADVEMPEVPAERINAELAWAMRHYVESLGANNPVVLVIDDLQSAEAPLLDLIDHVSLRTSHVPVLWLCVARSEFVEAHPRWAGGQRKALEITLTLLSSGETSTLINRLLDSHDVPALLRQRLVEQSGGNPLFCEQLFRMLIDEHQLVREEAGWRIANGISTVRIPETIQAVVAARLDSLPQSEKQTLQAASVVGERFADDEVAALRPGVDVTRALDGLLQKGLVIQGDGKGDDGELRFGHLLIRDVAYGTLVKAERAGLHDRFASFLEKTAGDRQGEYADLITYHASEALTLSVEMRLPADIVRSRAERALSWNLFSAERARSLNHWPALADRTSVARLALSALAKPSDAPQSLRLRLLEAEQLLSNDAYDAAIAAAREVIRSADGSPQLAAAAHLCLARIDLRREGYLPFTSAQHEANEAARLFRSVEDHAGELEAMWLEAFSSTMASDPLGTLDRCRPLAALAAKLKEYARAASWMSMLAYIGREAGHPEVRTMARDAQRWTDSAGSRPSAALTAALAGIDAMSGQVETAVAELQEAIKAKADEAWDLILLERLLATILMNAGRLAEADRLLEQAIKESEDSGEHWHRCELFARRSLIALRQQNLELAERFVQSSLALARPSDESAMAESHGALAELRAAQGRDAEADAAYETSIQALKTFSPGPVSQDVEFSRARYLVNRGRGREALPILETYEAWLNAMDYTYGLEEIARLRERVQSEEAASQKPQ
jgi:class 3 adenylate cyclase/tetratricopeptide (TPR) repeat protein